MHVITKNDLCHRDKSAGGATLDMGEDEELDLQNIVGGIERAALRYD